MLSAIRLYEEAPVVLVSRDHLLAALEPEEPVALDDLADDVLLRPLDDVVPWAGEAGAADDAPPPPGRPAEERPATTGDAVVLVAANVGVAVVPQSLARLHHRKDVTYRRLDGAPSAPVALAWVADRDDDLVEEMVGIVRGRTANSSRGRRAATPRRTPRPPASAATATRAVVRAAGSGRWTRCHGAGRAGGGRGGGGGAQGRGTPKGRGARGRGGKRR